MFVGTREVRIPAESAETALHGVCIAAGGISAIWPHSAARSTTRMMSRISMARARAGNADFSSSVQRPNRPENSKRPPTRRNSRISPVSSCCCSMLPDRPWEREWRHAPHPAAMTCSCAADRAEPRLRVGAVWARGAGNMRGSCYAAHSWFVASVRSAFREPWSVCFGGGGQRPDSLRTVSLPFASSYVAA